MKITAGQVWKRRCEIGGDPYNHVEVLGHWENEIRLRPVNGFGSVISATAESLQAAFDLASDAPPVAEPEAGSEMFTLGREWLGAS